MAKKQKMWTDEEIELLKSNSTKDYTTLMSLFPDRSLKSIKHKITNMKLLRKIYYERYTDVEDSILIENSYLTVSEIQKLLPSRTVESIIQRYNYLGMEWNKTWEFWTDDELLILETYDKLEELKRHLPQKTENSIIIKANKIGKYLRNWTDNELTILKNNYGQLQVSEFIHLLPNRNEQSVYSKANELGLKGLMGKYEIKDDQIIELFDNGMYPSQISRELGITHNTVAFRLRRNGINFEPYVLSGDKNYNWKGGISQLSTYLRDKIRQWKNDSMINSNFKCVISGKRFDQIHHLIGFDSILRETLELTDLPLYSKVNEYTEEELNVLKETCIELHQRYPLGVCLTKENHSDFHNAYGYGNNTPEQFYEFYKIKTGKTFLHSNNEEVLCV